jgi:hypothetical protein
MSGSLPISNPAMLRRGRSACAARAHTEAANGESVIRLRSSISRTPARRTTLRAACSHAGVSSNTQRGIVRSRDAQIV